MSDKYRNFSDMVQSLRAGAASGMNVVITLEPESARHLADIIEGAEREAAMCLIQALGQELEHHLKEP